MLKNFQQRRGWRNIVRSKPVLILLGVILLVSAWNVRGFMEKMQIASEKREAAESRLNELKDRKMQLTAGLSRLETESGVEESIREKFGLAKEGEGLVVVVEDKNKVEVEEEKPGWLESLWNKVFK